MFQYKLDKSFTIDKLNNYFNARSFDVVLMGGTPPSVSEGRIIDRNDRASDELGRITQTFTNGNMSTSVTFTPTASGAITWAKIMPSGVADNIVVTTDHIGVEGSSNLIWVQNVICTAGVDNKVINAYFQFDFA